MVVFKNLGPTPSGPAAEFSFKFLIFSIILASVIFESQKDLSVSGAFTGMLFRFYSVKTAAKKVFSSSAISLSSAITFPSLLFRGPMLIFVFVFDLM